MSSGVPETKVLAIASHVVYGYVGNTMATFVMQSLGCEVSAINTVHFSNHTGYKQVKGRKTPAEEIQQLYEGLQQSLLNDFDVLLSGYIPSAEAVEEVGKIGRELKYNSAMKPGSFFWVLDPVMGDAGHLYVSEDVVPVYKSLLRHADLILPNQFEAETLSDVKITDLSTLATAIQTLHHSYQVPHIIITSIRLSKHSEKTIPGSYSTSAEGGPGEDEIMSVIGSTARSDHSPRLWRIDIPIYPVFFSGTGDMFAALTVARLREAVFEAGIQNTARWQSPDDVEPTDLPLAKAAEKVLASMQAVLQDTYEFYKNAIPAIEAIDERTGEAMEEKAIKKRDKLAYLRKTKAAEVRVVRNVASLINPPDVGNYRAVAVDVEFTKDEGDSQPGELTVVNSGGGADHGAVHTENDSR
ncbi:Ribokinase-like protein [Tothia fuscella]|uniref:pyridoxal kinase n=1 Tax=Tothia fuscella TaxID=1048955 RepID=A0A9P4P3D7_9PEZI|nr:Ribokinase-like protein [Tothia fuscella]